LPSKKSNMRSVLITPDSACKVFASSWLGIGHSHYESIIRHFKVGLLPTRFFATTGFVNQ
jgi:hypothetical protein